MWLKEIEVMNLGPHTHVHQHLCQGTVGIFGRNGSGKSTLVELMYAALTGNFARGSGGRFYGVTQDCIRTGSVPKDPAFVRAVFEHNGTTAEVKRTVGLKTTTHELKLGGKTYNGTRDIDEQLARLGIDARLLDFCVFRRQGEVHSFLNDQPAVRARAYQTLNQTEHARTLYDGLGKFLARHQEGAEAVVDNRDELRSAVRRVASDLAEGEQRLTQLTAQLQRAAARAARAEEALAAWKQRREVVAAVRAFRTERTQVRAEVQERTAVLRAAHAERQQARAATKGLTADEEERIRKRLHRWTTYNAAAGARQALEDQQRRVQHELAQPGPSPVEPTRIAALAKKATLCEAEAEQCARILAAFRVAEAQPCPTCAQPYTLTAAARRQLETQRDKARAAAKALTAEGETLAAAERNYAAWARTRQQREGELAAVTTRLAAEAVPVPPKRTAKKLQEDLQRCRTLRARQAAAETAWQQAKLRNAQARGNWKALQARRGELWERWTRLRELDKAQAQQAWQTVRRHRRRQQALQQLKGRLAELRRQRAQREQELETAVQRLRAAARLRAMLEVVTRVRQVCHHDHLPRRVAQANLVRLEPLLNQGLKLLGAPFWAEADDDLNLLVHLAGKVVRPAQRLSVGQQSVLAVAFWNAVGSLFAAGLGMLVLDEPTAHLDRWNLRFLKEALAAMSQQVRGRRQIIIVTHEHDLRAAFDQVVVVGDEA